MPEWRDYVLGDVTDNFDSMRVPVKGLDRKPGPYLYYGASGIIDHIDDFIFDGEYLLVAEDGENLRTRKTAIAFMADGKFWVNNHAHIIRGNDVADTRYLCYLLSVTDISGYLTGSTQPKLTQSNMNRIPLRLPSMATQRWVVSVLDSLTDKIELNRRMNRTLEAMARAIFKSWFIDFDPVIDNAFASGKSIPEELRKRAEIRTGQNQPSPLPSPNGRGWQEARSDGAYGVSSSPFGRGEGEGAVAYHRLFPDEFQDSPLGKIPKGWEVMPFSEAVEINPPRTLKKGQVAPYVDMASLPTAGSQLETPPAAREYKSGSRFRNGDVLFARITPCLENGKTVLVDFLEDGVVGAGSTEFLVFGPRLAGTYFVYCASRWGALREHAIASMTGTSGRQRAQKGAFDHFDLAVPATELMDAFESHVAPMFAIQRNESMESRSLSAIRDSLLPRLLSGDVSPSEGGANG